MRRRRLGCGYMVHGMLDWDQDQGHECRERARRMEWREDGRNGEGESAKVDVWGKVNCGEVTFNPDPRVPTYISTYYRCSIDELPR